MLDGMFASLVYTPAMRKLIASFKYKPYVTDLSSLLSALFIEGIIQNETCMQIITPESVFVPIPLHPTKKRQRGYNHAELLAKQLSLYFSLKLEQPLRRVKKTSSQFGLPREKRRDNLKDAFVAIQTFEKVPQAILVDDIVTTGTTFAEAAKVLKKHGVGKVYGLALAHGK